MKKVTVGRTEPVAFVTKGKHRLKQYKDKSTVYLRNGDEFELELFNPTSDKVLAKIHLNGNSIGAGIVLRPGERAFIERYIEEARKFMFQTYEVNGKSEDVKRAIANNGDVRVLFYRESQPVNVSWTTNWPSWGWTYTNSPVYGTPTITNTPTFGGGDIIGTSASCFYSNALGDSGEVCLDGSLDFEPEMDVKKSPSRSRGFSKSLKSSKSVETGRIDKGNASNQSFSHDYSTFETYWTWESKWKILPLSQKEVVSEDMKVFCTNCGTRQRKSSHKFCPNCGTKY